MTLSFGDLGVELDDRVGRASTARPRSRPRRRRPACPRDDREGDRLRSGRDQQLHRRALGDRLADRRIGLRRPRPSARWGSRSCRVVVVDVEAEVVRIASASAGVVPAIDSRDRDRRARPEPEPPAGAAGEQREHDDHDDEHDPAAAALLRRHGEGGGRVGDLGRGGGARGDARAEDLGLGLGAGARRARRSGRRRERHDAPCAATTVAPCGQRRAQQRLGVVQLVEHRARVARAAARGRAPSPRAPARRARRAPAGSWCSASAPRRWRAGRRSASAARP